MRAKISQKSVATLQPNTVIWDGEVRGFYARRQFSEIVTYSVFYRNHDGIQKWHKLGRAPILTANLARKEAIRVLRTVAMEVRRERKC